MLRKIFIPVLGIMAAVTMAGCITAKTYVINKPRVDQDIPGMPQQEQVKTRKMIVVELIEKDKPGSVAPRPVVVAEKVPQVTAEEKNFDLPQSVVVAAKQPEPLTVPQEYVVEKDDTLQKIAKKVYGSYSKWTLIYDANRDVLKDPNFLKAGIKIKIPSLDIPTVTEVKAEEK